MSLAPRAILAESGASGGCYTSGYVSTARGGQGMVRVALWFLVAWDALELSRAMRAIPSPPQGAGTMVLFLVLYLLGLAQFGAVLLALRWRARTSPAPRVSLPAMMMLGLALVSNIVWLFMGAFGLAFGESLRVALKDVAYALANTVALVAAWRWRPWARASPAAG
jgi:hypothetical protein